MLLVKNSINNDRKWCEKNIIKLINPRIIDRSTWKTVDKTKPELRQYQEQIFVKIEQNKLGIFSIWFSTMIEHKLPKDLKLWDGVIWANSSLGTLNSFDPNSNMCSIDHVDIIGSISNTESCTFIFPH